MKTLTAERPQERSTRTWRSSSLALLGDAPPFLLVLIVTREVFLRFFHGRRLDGLIVSPVALVNALHRAGGEGGRYEGEEQGREKTFHRAHDGLNFAQSETPTHRDYRRRPSRPRKPRPVLRGCRRAPATDSGHARNDSILTRHTRFSYFGDVQRCGRY